MDNSKILGIHHIIFQYQFNGFVKCFLDDKEGYYPLNDFIKLTNNLNDRDKIIPQLKEALSESSLFLWDIDNSFIRRLDINDWERENVFISKPFNFDDKEDNIFDPQNDIGFKKGKVTKKKLKLF